MGSDTINIPHTQYSTDGDTALHDCPHLTPTTPRIRATIGGAYAYLCAYCYNDHINSPKVHAHENIKLSFVRATSKKQDATTTPE